MPAMRTGRFILFLIVLSFGSVVAHAQEAPEAPEAEAASLAVEPDALLGAWQQRAAEQGLVGTWTATMGELTAELVLRPDRTFTLDDLSGHYEIRDNHLILTNGEVITYEWSIVDGQLQIAGGNLRSPITFAPQPQAPGYVAWLFDVSPETLWRRLQRIVIIIFIVAMAGVVISAFRWLSHKVIFSNWGPLGWVYRRRRNRARTVHSLVLNVVKYFIYFTAAGMILAEMGINYTTYIASLSVVGLAIGFGSQGLVQDMVTGFFIIFEEQFDVGDMVEIGGQTGVVQEIGLRMTKLRNYVGQIVVIPNRNILTVANYSRGAQRCYVDVMTESHAAAAQAAPILDDLARELCQQFQGVVLGPINVTTPPPDDTGDLFVRLHLSLWPGQTWVVDTQLIPRLRERFAAAGIAIPNDRVSAFYHARERVPVEGLFDRLRGRITGLRRRGERDVPPPTPAVPPTDPPPAQA